MLIVSRVLWPPAPRPDRTSRVCRARLNRLHLAANRHSGTLPSQLTDMRNLRALLLQDNLFTGNLPQQIGKVCGVRCGEWGVRCAVRGVRGGVWGVRCGVCGVGCAMCAVRCGVRGG